MSDEVRDPIPDDLKQAFSEAIRRCGDRWPGDEDQVVVRLRGQEMTVRVVAELVANFNDTLPDEDLDALLALTEFESSLLRNPSYEGGSEALIAVIDIKNESRRPARPAENPKR